MVVEGFICFFFYHKILISRVLGVVCFFYYLLSYEKTTQTRTRVMTLTQKHRHQ